MSDIKRIETRAELTALAVQLGVLPDWHEPGEQEVTAEVHGSTFDNAGFWGTAEAARLRAGHSDTPYVRAGIELMIEKYVILCQDSKPVAEVNLATLFAFATGFEG